MQTKAIVREGDRLQLSMFDIRPETLSLYVEAMREFEPIWFQAMPSLLGRLASHMLDLGLRPPSSLKLIELTGEILFDHDRTTIEAAFPAVSIANRYASTEQWAIAYECPNNLLHVLDDNVYLELTRSTVDLSRRVGDAVVTNRHFVTMPLLRYSLGDRLEITRQECICGRSGDVVDVVRGRTIQFVEGRGGHQVYPSFFNVTVARTNWVHPGAIRRFQLVRAPACLEVHVEPGPSWSQAAEQVLRDAIGERFESDAFNLVLGAIRRVDTEKFQPLRDVSGERS